LTADSLVWCPKQWCASSKTAVGGTVSATIKVTHGDSCWGVSAPSLSHQNARAFSCQVDTFCRATGALAANNCCWRRPTSFCTFALDAHDHAGSWRSSAAFHCGHLSSTLAGFLFFRLTSYRASTASISTRALALLLLLLQNLPLLLLCDSASYKFGRVVSLGTDWRPIPTTFSPVR
jgi:hypothetical protein